MKKLRAKLAGQKGFSFVELLACVFTLLLIAAICTTGLELAINSHQQSLFVSESQNLEETLNTAIGDTLRYAGKVQPGAGGPVFDNEYYQLAGVSFETVDGMLQLSNGTKLIGTKAYAGTLFLEGFTLDYTDGVFTGSYVIRSRILGDGTQKQCSFAFRTVADTGAAGADPDTP